MSGSRLVFLGPSSVGVETPAGELRWEGEVLRSGAALPLTRKRSPWRSEGEAERVIVGSHAARADVRLEGEGIYPEHVRIYLPRDRDRPADLLAINPGSTRVNGRSVEPRQWRALAGGEEIDLGPWRFRYEAEERVGPASGS